MKKNFQNLFVRFGFRSFWSLICLVWALVGSNLSYSFQRGGQGDGQEGAQDDAITSFTGLGRGFLSQSIDILTHFASSGSKSHLIEKRIDDDQGLVTRKKQKALPLYWNFGLGYSSLSSPATAVDPRVEDSVISGRLGMGWDSTSRFGANFQVGLDTIPYEAYRHGWVVLKFEYTWHLARKSKNDQEIEELIQSSRHQRSNSASQYYEDERERKMKQLEQKWQGELAHLDEAEEIEKEVRRSYPRLKLIYNLGIHAHSVQSKLVRVPSKANGSAQEMILNQVQNGPELEYSPDPMATYKLAVSYYRVSADVGNFISLLDLGDSFRVPAYPYNGISAASNQLLSFPSWYIGLSSHWELNRHSSLDLSAANILYSSQNQSVTYSLYPVYNRIFFDRWELSIGANFTWSVSVASVFGSLGLSYHL